MKIGKTRVPKIFEAQPAHPIQIIVGLGPRRPPMDKRPGYQYQKSQPYVNTKLKKCWHMI